MCRMPGLAQGRCGDERRLLGRLTGVRNTNTLVKQAARLDHLHLVSRLVYIERDMAR